MDGLELEVEFFRVRECGRHKDAAKCPLEARHSHVQQVPIIKIILHYDDLRYYQITLFYVFASNYSEWVVLGVSQ